MVIFLFCYDFSPRLKSWAGLKKEIYTEIKPMTSVVGTI